MRKWFLILPVITIMTQPFIEMAWADEGLSLTQTVQGALNNVNIPTTIEGLKSKAVNVGAFYDIRNNAVQPTYTYTFYHPFRDLDLNVGYANPNILLAEVAYPLNVGGVMKKLHLTIPNASIQSFMEALTLDIGLGAGLEQVLNKNKITGGPTVAAKVKF